MEANYQVLQYHHHDSVSYNLKLKFLLAEAIQSLDPMLACKQPIIGSGATAIGSTARAPDKVQNSDAKIVNNHRGSTARAH